MNGWKPLIKINDNNNNYNKCLYYSSHANMLLGLSKLKRKNKCTCIYNTDCKSNNQIRCVLSSRWKINKQSMFLIKLERKTDIITKKSRCFDCFPSRSNYLMIRPCWWSHGVDTINSSLILCITVLYGPLLI